MGSRHLRTPHRKFAQPSTSVIAFTTPHRNTIEIMRLFAAYHSAHSRFTLRDATASTMTAWRGGNISSHGGGTR
jgi:hypothetical protein